METVQGVAIGVDVGADRRGFHVAIVATGKSVATHALLHFDSPLLLCEHLYRLCHTNRWGVHAIAVDAPPRSLRKRKETRSAEREVRSRGYRVLWTPRKKSQEQGWMKNGALLWKELRTAFPDVPIIEVFPTFASDTLARSPLLLPTRLLHGKRLRSFYKDYVDALVAASVARDYPQVEGVGLDDEMGAIHRHELPGRLLTLAMIVKGKQILLGKKKRGFGAGYWNGFGGKVERKESLNDAVAREVREECGLVVKKARLAGRLQFTFESRATGELTEDGLMDVHVFSVTGFDGSPVESEEMKPAWFDFEQVPYESMWADDRYWLPYMLAGHGFEGYFHFDDNHKLLAHNLQVLAKK